MFRIGNQFVFMAVFRACERMVASNPTIFFFIEFEHREVDDPKRFPAFFEQTVRFTEVAVTDLQAQSTERVEDDLLTVSTEENNVAVFSTGSVENLSKNFIM